MVTALLNLSTACLLPPSALLHNTIFTHNSTATLLPLAFTSFTTVSTMPLHIVLVVFHYILNLPHTPTSTCIGIHIKCFHLTPYILNTFYIAFQLIVSNACSRSINVVQYMYILSSLLIKFFSSIPKMKIWCTDFSLCKST